jgi:hypothetical protein
MVRRNIMRGPPAPRLAMAKAPDCMQFPRMRHPAFALLALVTTIGCKGDSIAAPEPERVMRASINGSEFVAAGELYAQYVNGVLAIAARASDGRTIHLTVLNSVRPEVIEVGAGSANSAFTAHGYRFWRSNLEGGSGTVTITKIDTYGASGSFAFTAVAQPNTPTTGRRNVVGTFRVRYD